MINNEGILKCPVCQGTYLHQVKYHIFSRADDAPTGTRVDVNEHVDVTFVNNTSMQNCPSPRRDGLVIQFYCEDCDADAEQAGAASSSKSLAIYQHKGGTFLEWME